MVTLDEIFEDVKEKGVYPNYGNTRYSRCIRTEDPWFHNKISFLLITSCVRPTPDWITKVRKSPLRINSRVKIRQPKSDIGRLLVRT